MGKNKKPVSVTVRTEGYEDGYEVHERHVINAFFEVKFSDGTVGYYESIDQESIKDNEGVPLVELDRELDHVLSDLMERPTLTSMWDEYTDKDGCVEAEYDLTRRGPRGPFLVSVLGKNGMEPPDSELF